MNQKIFGARNYFEWTADNWYRLPENVDQIALRDRNELAKQLKKEGYRVSKFALGTQLYSMGGIGSGKPHIEFVGKAYGVNYWKD